MHVEVFSQLYIEVIQDEKSVFWEVIQSVVVRKYVHINVRQILNSWMYKYKGILNGNKGREVIQW